MSASVMDMPAVEGSTAPLGLLGSGLLFKPDRAVPAMNVWSILRKQSQNVSYGTTPTQCLFYGVMAKSYEGSDVASAQSVALPLWPESAATDIDGNLLGVRLVEAEPVDTWPIGINIEAVRIPNRVTEARFRSAFQRAREEYFEDGMDSQFTTDLSELVSSHVADAKNILIRMIDDNVGSPRVWAEAMRWFGNAQDLLTRSDVFALLRKGLFSPYPEVRDGAIVGLADLDDPESISLLHQAKLGEASSTLQGDIDQVLEQLKNR